MNIGPHSATPTTQTILFEPTTAGGGSLWNGDSLLATLTVLTRPQRQGRLSIRDTGRAVDMLRLSRKQRTRYRLIQDLGQTGDAEWVTGEPTAALRYRGQAYLVTREGLLSIPDRQPVIAPAFASDWTARQTELHFAREADLALVAFFLFVSYDLSLAHTETKA